MGNCELRDRLMALAGSDIAIKAAKMALDEAALRSEQSAAIFTACGDRPQPVADVLLERSSALRELSAWLVPQLPD